MDVGGGNSEGEEIAVEGSDLSRSISVEVGAEPTEESSVKLLSHPSLEGKVRVSCLKCDGSEERVPFSKCGETEHFQSDDDLSSPIAAEGGGDVGAEDVPCDSCGRIEKGHQTDSASPQKKEYFCKEYWGIMLSLASGLASTFGGIIVKQLKLFHPFSLATYRFQGILLPTLIILLYCRVIRKENVFRTIWPLTEKDKLKKFGFTIVRAVIGCAGLYLYFYAIKLMPLADAKVILSCRPVFVIFIARVFLKEPCGVFPVATSILAVFGVAIIARPPILTGQENFDEDTLKGTIFATLSMLTATIAMVVLRYLRGVHVSIVTLAFGFWGTIFSIVCSTLVGGVDVPEATIDWILIVLLAVSAFFSQTALTLAMKYEHAGAVVIVGTCDTIMSFILQYLFLGDKPDKYSIFGAAIIIVCVSLITFRKWVNSLEYNNSIRKVFGFVLR